MQKIIRKLRLLLVIILSGWSVAACDIPYESLFSVAQKIYEEQEKQVTEDQNDEKAIAGQNDDSDYVTEPVDGIGSVEGYSGEPFTYLNENQPEFREEEMTSTKPFERYSELDSLGRCGVAYANICKKTMPKKKRGAIGSVKPSGWHTIKYNGLVDGNYLYNRCHLIGYQLAGENANEKNLITGTRYLNVDGMLPFEDEVADYVHDTGHHVLYRVTPVYQGKDLIAQGVQMEAYSVEDHGEGVCFNVFVYNVQPGVVIDYGTGESTLSQN